MRTCSALLDAGGCCDNQGSCLNIHSTPIIRTTQSSDLHQAPFRSRREQKEHERGSDGSLQQPPRKEHSLFRLAAAKRKSTMLRESWTYVLGRFSMKITSTRYVSLGLVFDPSRYDSGLKALSWECKAVSPCLANEKDLTCTCRNAHQIGCLQFVLPESTSSKVIRDEDIPSCA